jgi:hypothetical protein
MVATTVANNIAVGHPFRMSEEPRIAEASFVKESLGWESWFPWVWTSDVLKFGGTGIQAWSEYFNFPDREKLGASNRRISKWNKSDLDLQIIEFPFLIEALRRIFIFSSAAEIEISKFLPEKSMLANSRSDYFSVHIRRGENISEDEMWTRPNVPFIPIKTYADSAKDLAFELGIDEVFISTDSLNSLEQFAALCPDLKILSNNIERKKFFRPSIGEIEDVETYVRKHPSECSFYAHTALADLYMLSGSKGIVGTISVSEFSKTGWYLAVAKSNSLVPFRSVSGPFNLRDKDSFYLH